MKEVFRTFLAFDFDDKTKKRLAEIQKEYGKLITSGKVSYTKPWQMHITTFFLGDITEDRAGRIIKALKKKELSGPLQLTFKELSYFPSLRSPRVIVIKADEDEKLICMVKEYDSEITALGFKRDKKWIPHVTLGRVRKQINIPEYYFPPIEINIESLTLFRSTLTEKGSVYDKLFSLPVL